MFFFCYSAKQNRGGEYIIRSYKRERDGCRKTRIEPLTKTKLGVSRAILDYSKAVWTGSYAPSMKGISLRTTLSDTFIGVNMLAFHPRHHRWQEAGRLTSASLLYRRPPPGKHRTTHHFLLLVLLPLFILFYFFILLSIYCGYVISFIVNIPGAHDPKRATPLYRTKSLRFQGSVYFRYILEPFLPGTSRRSAPSMSAFEEKEY